MEVIICTPANSGRLVNHLYQKFAPAKNPLGSKRGHDVGEAPKNKKNLSSSRLKFTSNEVRSSRQVKEPSFSTKNNLIALTNPVWVSRPAVMGGLVVLFLALSFLNAPKAHAAEDWGNKDLVAAIKNVGPIVSTNAAQGKEQTQTVSTENYIEKPIVAETQITILAPTRKVLAAQSTRAAADYSLVKGPHYFPYGYCTYYVSQKREITWSGNAGTWLTGAKSAGKETGNTPQAGAVMVTSEGGRAGHVAYVEQVSGDQVTVSEMNYKGYGIVSSRTVAVNSKFIKGYIY